MSKFIPLELLAGPMRHVGVDREARREYSRLRNDIARLAWLDEHPEIMGLVFPEGTPERYRTDAEYRAEHVPGSAEYGARHGTGTDLAANALRSEARAAYDVNVPNPGMPQPRASEALATGTAPSVEAPMSDLGDRAHAALTEFASKKGFYLAPDIPTSKLAAARTAAGLPEGEEVLALIDCTAFGSAKNAIIFDRNGLCYHDGKQTGSLTYQRFMHDFVISGSYLEWDDGTKVHAVGTLSMKTMCDIMLAVRKAVISAESEKDQVWQEEYRRLRERLRNRQWVRVILDAAPPKSGVVTRFVALAGGALIGGAAGNPNAFNETAVHVQELAGHEQPTIQAPDSCIICGIRPAVCKSAKTMSITGWGDLAGDVLGIPGSSERTVTVVFGVCRFCPLHSAEFDGGGVRIVAYEKALKPAKPIEGTARHQRRPWRLTLEFINDRVAAEFVRLNQAAHACILPPVGFITSDRNWRWDGRQWRHVSPDGRWWWDGARWQPMQ